MRFLMFVLVIFLISCQPPQKAHRDPYVLNRVLSSDPISLNPLTYEDANSGAIIAQIYESLLRRNRETLELEGLLARRWTMSSDHLTYMFYLRDDVRFQDGVQMTAEDVEYSFSKIVDPDVPNPHLKVYYNIVKDVKAVDTFTVRMRLKYPYYKATEMLGGFEIIPKHVFEKEEDFVTGEAALRKPVGTGPYILNDWKTGRKVVLDRNENYWGEKPEIRRHVYRILKNESVMLQALKKRELDYLGLRPFQYTRQITGSRFQDHFETYKYLGKVYRYIGYNTKHFPFDQRDVRVAMTYATNREQIKKSVYYDLVEIVTGSFFMKSQQYNTRLKAREYSLEKAKELLKGAGYRDSDGDGFLDLNGKKFTFELIIPASITEYEQIAAILQESLEKIGIRMEIRKLEFQTLIAKVNNRDFDAIMLGWSTPIDSDPYQLWHSSQVEKGHNFTGFTTREMDDIIERARVEFNPVKRNALYHRFHEILYENQPYTFLFSPYELAALHRRFENVILYPAGMDPNRWRVNAQFDY